MIVHEVGDLGVVRTPAQEEQPIELAGIGIADEGARLLLVKRGNDADLGELLLDVLGHGRRIREVAAEDVAVRDLGLEPVRVAGLGQEILGLLDLVGAAAGEPVRALAAVLDGAWCEVGRDLGALGVEVVDDALAVDRERDGLPDLDLVPRLVVVIHAEVQGVQRLALGGRGQHQGRVVRNRGEVVRADERHAHHVARLQGLQARAGLSGPLQDGLRDLRVVRLVPVVVEGAVDQAVTLAPFVQLVWPGAIHAVLDRAVRGVLLDPGAVVDVEDRERHLLQEGDIRGTQVEDDGHVVGRLDRLEVALVLLAVERAGGAPARAGDLTGLRVLDRRCSGCRGCRPCGRPTARRCARRRRTGGSDECHAREQRRDSRQSSRRTGHAGSPPTAAPRRSGRASRRSRGDSHSAADDEPRPRVRAD